MKRLTILLSTLLALLPKNIAFGIETHVGSTYLPLSKASYYHFAKDQNLSDLIRDFFAMQGITVVVSDRINQPVNGRFSNMAPTEFWDYVVRAYGLVWFYDGKIMFVYSNSELQTQIFRMDLDGIQTLSIILSRLGFAASDFSFREVGEANVLIVTAPPQYITVINDISSKFVPNKISDTTIVKVIPLKYAWAYDMSFNYANGSITVPGVSSLLSSILTGEQSQGSISPFNLSVGGKAEQMQNSKMLGMLDDTPAFAKNLKNNPQSKDKSDEKSSEDKTTADISGSSLSGFITCDQRLNAVVIRDRKENMPFYEEIISKLDVPCEVIKIDVAVVNVNKNASLALGIKGIGIKSSGTTGAKWNAGVSTTAGDMTVKEKSALPTAESWKGFVAGALGVIRNHDIITALDAMEQSGSGQTISKPSVLTLDNVAAIVEGDRTQYSTISGQYNSNAYSQTATTRLQVVPHIIPGDVDENGKRKMKLFVDISEGSFESIGKDVNPVVVHHSINTQSVLYEGQSLMIGGYNTETHSQSKGGIPILKDVPIIGMLFRSSSKGKEVKERIYVISPSVVEIRSDDNKYQRFIQEGQLTAATSLNPEEFSLTTEWHKEKSTKSIRKRNFR